MGCIALIVASNNSATHGCAAIAIEGIVGKTDNRAILACFGLPKWAFEDGCVHVWGEARIEYENKSFGDHSDEGVHF